MPFQPSSAVQTASKGLIAILERLRSPRREVQRRRKTRPYLERLPVERLEFGTALSTTASRSSLKPRRDRRRRRPTREPRTRVVVVLVVVGDGGGGGVFFSKKTQTSRNDVAPRIRTVVGVGGVVHHPTEMGVGVPSTPQEMQRRPPRTRTFVFNRTRETIRRWSFRLPLLRVVVAVSRGCAERRRSTQRVKVVLTMKKEKGGRFSSGEKDAQKRHNKKHFFFFFFFFRCDHHHLLRERGARNDDDDF